MTYELLDSGSGRKLEQFQDIILARPCSQAVWTRQENESVWQKAHGSFERVEQKGWSTKHNLPDAWVLETHGIKFNLKTTDFGHLGVFPEQRPFWKWIKETISSSTRPLRVLNLFAYSGGSTIAAAQGGAEVCHLDASKGMVQWARENAELNNLSKAPIRWIVEDVTKFLQREIKRGSFYDAIILDPPSFGRGAKGEIFKIEEEINNLLTLVNTLLTNDPAFVLFSCHTPGFTPVAMKQLLQQSITHKGIIQEGEMLLKGDSHKTPFAIPSGTFALWRASWTSSI